MNTGSPNRRSGHVLAACLVGVFVASVGVSCGGEETAEKSVTADSSTTAVPSTTSAPTTTSAPATTTSPTTTTSQERVTIGDQFRAPDLKAPRTLQLWVSDALVKLKWRGWGSPQATATGFITTHSGGNYTNLPTRVTASQIQKCSGQTIYGRLTYEQDGRTVDAVLSKCRFSAG